MTPVLSMALPAGADWFPPWWMWLLFYLFGIALIVATFNSAFKLLLRTLDGLMAVLESASDSTAANASPDKSASPPPTTNTSGKFHPLSPWIGLAVLVSVVALVLFILKSDRSAAFTRWLVGVGLAGYLVSLFVKVKKDGGAAGPTATPPGEARSPDPDKRNRDGINSVSKNDP